MKKISWYLKQLLPLKYKSTFRTGLCQRHTMTFNMWFGKVFNIRHYSPKLFFASEDKR
jgi:hypothetical protein